MSKIGNQNAAKPESEKLTSYIHARCHQKDKALWVKAAQSEKLKLTEWITKTLNNAVKQPVS